MKKIFLLLLTLVTSLQIYAKEVKVTITELPYGYEFYNDFKGKPLCNDNIIILNNSENEFTMDIFVKNSKTAEYIQKESFIVHPNKSFLPFNLSLYKYVLLVPQNGKMILYSANNKHSDLNITISSFDSLNNDIYFSFLFLNKIKEIQSDKNNYKSGDYYFTFDKEGSGCSILLYTGSKKDSLEIPSVIEDLPVTEIKRWYSTNVQNIIIPASVKRISEYAFFRCGLSSVEFAENSNLEFIASGAFKDNKIRDFIIPKTSESKKIKFCQNIYSGNPINKVKFNKNWDITTEYVGFVGSTGLYDLEEVEFEEGIESINYGMFEGCKKLKHVSLPSTVFILWDRAFYDCTSLTSVSFPSSVSFDKNLIVRDVFKNCPLDFKTVKALRAAGLGDRSF